MFSSFLKSIITCCVYGFILQLSINFLLPLVNIFSGYIFKDGPGMISNVFYFQILGFFFFFYIVIVSRFVIFLESFVSGSDS